MRLVIVGSRYKLAEVGWSSHVITPIDLQARLAHVVSCLLREASEDNIPYRMSLSVDLGGHARRNENVSQTCAQSSWEFDSSLL
jgi:hypothetical protein